MMAAATGVPVSVMETAGEGGAWGIALLASYMVQREPGETLSDFLSLKVFAGKTGFVMQPDPMDKDGFERFFRRYQEGLPIEKAAVLHVGA